MHVGYGPAAQLPAQPHCPAWRWVAAMNVFLGDAHRAQVPRLLVREHEHDDAPACRGRGRHPRTLTTVSHVGSSEAQRRRAAAKAQACQLQRWPVGEAARPGESAAGNWILPVMVNAPTSRCFVLRSLPFSSNHGQPHARSSLQRFTP